MPPNLHAPNLHVPSNLGIISESFITQSSLSESVSSSSRFVRHDVSTLDNGRSHSADILIVLLAVEPLAGQKFVPPRLR